MNELARTVKEIRTRQGRTQKEVADAGGFSPTLLTRLETGRAKYVTWRDLGDLANGLGVSLRELLDCIPETNRGNRYMGLN